MQFFLISCLKTRFFRLIQRGFCKQIFAVKYLSFAAWCPPEPDRLNWLVGQVYHFVNFARTCINCRTSRNFSRYAAHRPLRLAGENIINFRRSVFMAVISLTRRQLPKTKLDVRVIQLATLGSSNQRLPASHVEIVNLPGDV